MISTNQTIFRLQIVDKQSYYEIVTKTQVRGQTEIDGLMISFEKDNKKQSGRVEPCDKHR